MKGILIIFLSSKVNEGIESIDKLKRKLELKWNQIIKICFFGFSFRKIIANIKPMPLLKNGPVHSFLLKI